MSTVTFPISEVPVARLTGSYDSTEDYISTHFRLLQKDAFANLKKGISDFVHGQLDPRDMTVWYEVSLIGVRFNHSFPGLVVGLQFTHDQANSSSSELPIGGSLLCICDRGGCFESPIWAVVAQCESKSKRKTIVFVEVLEGDPAAPSKYLTSSSPWARIMLASSMVVAESPTYYKAYEPVLKALQHLNPSTMPFQCELVRAKSSGQAPDYLNSSTTLNWSYLCGQNPRRTDNRDLRAGVHELVRPTLRGFQTILDKSQVAAVNHVLQNRFAMIQGPPGTGKTFLSVKIVELLLSASTVPQKPILIVAFKNQTLDNILELCLKSFKPEDIVRAGERGQSDKLAGCNLQRLIESRRKRFSGDWTANCEKLKGLQAELRKAVTNLYGSHSFHLETIMSQSWLQDFLNKLFTTSEAFREGEDILKQWMPSQTVLNDCLSALLRASEPMSQRCANAQSHETAIDHEQRDLDDVAKGHEGRKDIEQLWHNMKHIKCPGSKGKKETDGLSSIFLELADIDLQKNELFRSAPLLDCDLEGYHGLLKADPWQLSNEDRGILILLIMQKNQKNCTEQFYKLKKQCDQVLGANEESRKQIKISILKQKKIIGMTTTCAAMYQDILAAVSPAIILVEEAAELMEPQILALLSFNAQHLILVGDHKQLQPIVACHELKIRHNLAVSVLERLAEHNKLPYQMLLYQARMREEFVPMLENIYPNLQSNAAAVNGEENEPAKGMPSTMYFWNHSVDEITGRSPANKHEAHMVIALFRWLIAAGQKPDEITVLCAYRAQVLEIEAVLNESAIKEEATCRVKTIDEFQGSETQIVIASLVRSNEKGIIGHLSEQNRYCVTVSRARSGFYVCGNAKTLSQMSPDWKYLVDYFKNQKLFGEQINLVCPRHTHDPPIPLHSDDAQNFSPYICTKPCEALLACGHHCTRPCHNGEHAVCTMRVPYVFPDCQHSTLRPCSTPVTNLRCMKLVSITLDNCGHTKKCMCWQKAHNVSSALVCRLPCEKTLPCGHLCPLLCSEACGSKSCSECAKFEGAKERNLLVNQKEEKLSNNNCQIKKHKGEAKVGRWFKNLQEGETSAKTAIIKEQEEKTLLEKQIKENVTNISSQIKLKSESEVRLCSSKYLKGQGDTTAEPSFRNLVKDQKVKTIQPAHNVVPAVKRKKKGLQVQPDIKHFSTASTVWKRKQSEFEAPSETKNLLCAVSSQDATFQQTHQRVPSSYTQQGFNKPLFVSYQRQCSLTSRSRWKNSVLSMKSSSTASTLMRNKQMSMDMACAAKQTWTPMQKRKQNEEAWVRLMWCVSRARTIMARAFC